MDKYWYYATSIMTLLTGFRRPLQILAIFLKWPGALPATVQLRRSGWRFKARSAMDVWVIKETCLDADYLAFVGRLEANWSVVDIGAGLGDFTVLAAKQCHQGVVHAFEPLTESFDLLQHNLSLNGITNAHIFQTAVAARSTSMTIDTPDVAAVSTRFVESAGEGDTATVTFAKLLEGLPGGVCDFLKIDCEGCEFDLLLNSGPEALARIHRISLEYHDGYTAHSGNELATFLRQRGFNVQQRNNPVHGYLGFLYAEQSAGSRGIQRVDNK